MRKIDYAKTLNLPNTSFKMKANLPQKEGLMLRDWEKNKIYQKSIEDTTKPVFFLHDGPPYANGDIHIGHSINKILKDIILKYKRLRGFYAPYIPGWDTHGLPIEWKIIEQKGDKIANMSAIELRQECKKYALKEVEKQKKDFIRLGVLGDFANPYITLNKEFEAEELQVFKEIYENGYIYKGLKPVYWSPTTETALAEAEIEYKDVTSSTIYVKMDLVEDALSKLDIDSASIIIWTTTPWTLPANLGIALNKDLEYGVYETNKGNMIVATSLSNTAFSKMNLEFKLIKTFKGDLLENTHYNHPLFDRQGLVILADHVTDEAGTGCVHTAPGHGVDDFIAGNKYNLGVLSPVDDKGHLTYEAGKYEGLFYLKANKVIIEDLENSGYLLNMTEIKHSYPHDWRSKKPVIFRATEQWFINIAESDIRENALEALKSVKFYPDWGRNRINSMMENRPDWTISRQRVWGVPIPIFYNKQNEVVYYPEIMDRVIELVKKEGTDIWFKYSASEIIGQELLDKYNLNGEELRKEKSILDVWFDSGVTHRAVVKTRGFDRPVDLYLEGSDQHRGWFQSSLLTSIASTKDAPYKKILTHGFVNDATGRKMSKSIGNVIVPNEVIEKYGADILRLWASSVDYREDVRLSSNILDRMSDSYRKIRNTSRYLLGNIYDFDYEKDKVNYEDMLEIDKWALNKLERLKIKVEKLYESYEFYSLFQEILNFCIIDMSSFYLDIIKDRLYCDYRASVERRSAQTVMSEVLKVLVRIISPVLSFTAEEIWAKLPENMKDTESVHLSKWIEIDEKYVDDKLEKKWQKLHTLRKEVNKKIEEKRNEKEIGLSLDAKVLLNIKNSEFEFVKEYNELEISDILLVSQVEFVDEVLEETEIENISVKIVRALGEKCERCWKYSEKTGDPIYGQVTPRDAMVLKIMDENGELDDKYKEE
ncbi:isoleucine--tRNA ligase [Oceanivirga miroungae]|uniref:Isoleucine--tRNA ligase n=1 Tax=Oceanivirga miroungae TaxID=1130046 RepID=A0A6I8M6W6_9FUSO|nr:isoleucine--tRNA ligase [Oceanivirga miroungae]VWL85227.1 isoleucyl-tRNA synthetase [Oceanivirga miroungae]